MDEYAKEIEECVRLLTLDAETNEGWDLISEKNDIKISIKNEESNPLKSGKAVGIVKRSVSDVFELLQGIDSYQEVDKLYESGRIVKTFDHNHEIIYALYGSGMIFVAKRDFCYLEARKHLDNGGKLIACLSVNRPDECPEVDGVVRGHIFHSGWVLKPITPTPEEAKESNCDQWSHATFLAQVDLKGWIPTWVVNQLTKEIGMGVQNIRDYFKKLDKKNKAKNSV